MMKSAAGSPQRTRESRLKKMQIANLVLELNSERDVAIERTT